MMWYYWDETGQHDWNVGDDLPQGADLFKTEFLNQFYDACLDVGIMIYPYFDAISFVETLQEIIDGQDVSGNYNVLSGISTIRLMHNAIDYLLRQSHPDFPCLYVFIPSGNSSDVIGLPSAVYRTGDQVLAEVDLPASDGSTWFMARKTKIHPSDDDFTAFEYGLFAAGDIIGNWIFEDMRRVLDQTTMILYAIDNGFITRFDFDEPAFPDNAPLGQQGVVGSGSSDVAGYGCTVEYAIPVMIFGFSPVIMPSTRQLNWSLLCYPVDTGGTDSFSLGVNYNEYGLVRSGVFTGGSNEIILGSAMDTSLIICPFSSTSASTRTASFESRMSPDVYALMNTFKPNAKGSSLIVTVTRT